MPGSVAQYRMAFLIGLRNLLRHEPAWLAAHAAGAAIGAEAPARLGVVLAFESGQLAATRVGPQAADSTLGELAAVVVDACVRLARSLPPPGTLSERSFSVRIEVVQ